MKDFISLMVHKTDWMKTFVGVTVMAVFVFQAVWIIVRPVPEENREIVHFMLGEVVGMALTLPQYYFGSSKGSQEKTQIIKEQNEKIE
jgi:uncharacterized membrane protein